MKKDKKGRGSTRAKGDGEAGREQGGETERLKQSVNR